MSAAQQIRSLESNLALLDLQKRHHEALMAQNLAAQNKVHAAISRMRKTLIPSAVDQDGAATLDISGLLVQTQFLRGQIELIKLNEITLHRLNIERIEIGKLLADIVVKERVIKSLLAQTRRAENQRLEDIVESEQSHSWLINNRYS